ncbi:LysE family translocator [Pseudoglutamicibacter albus]|uniref:Threonine transporter n=1 Tax=Pseudoglutamicibacter albus DNF00011 TaxID=1401063 RepID=A0A095YED5_9MICC|nr:LysE family transporter [Pseudoglutamicibacter albus]KGF20476.1 hypothetical protein HMPREF2128_05230 [Pseudoglutamicibacter albus DNF00011]
METTAFLASLLPLLVTWAAGLMSPGPDLFVVLYRSLAGSRREGIAAALGITTSVGFYLALAFAGLGLLMRTVPWLGSALQIAGGAVLIWMGWGALRGWYAARNNPAIINAGGDWEKRAKEQQDAADQASNAAPSANPAHSSSTAQPSRTAPQGGPAILGFWGSWWRGCVTNLANPKFLIYITAMFAPFIAVERPLWQVSALLVLLLACTFGWFALIAFIAGAPALRTRMERWLQHLDLFAGLVFCALGLWFMIHGIIEVFT